MMNKKVNKTRVMLNLFQHLPRKVVLQQLQHALKTLKQVQGDFIIKNRAFTLIELLVVVLIIGILAAVALPQYRKAVLKTRFMQLIVLQDAIHNAEEVYRLANGAYTSRFDELDIEMPAGTITYNEGTNRSEWASGDYRILLAANWIQGYYNGMSYVRSHGSPTRICRSYHRTDVEKGICLGLGGQKCCSSCTDYDDYCFD